MIKKLLIIEDDEIYATSLIRALSRRKYSCQMAPTIAIGLELCQSFKPDRILLDLNLKGISSQEFISQIRRLCPQATLVVLTGYGTIPSAVQATKDGADHYLTKPTTPDDLEKTLEATREASPPLWDLENEHINKVLKECGGNISQAALKLGLHRRTLQRRLKKI